MSYCPHCPHQQRSLQTTSITSIAWMTFLLRHVSVQQLLRSRCCFALKTWLTWTSSAWYVSWGRRPAVLMCWQHLRRSSLCDWSQHNTVPCAVGVLNIMVKGDCNCDGWLVTVTSVIKFAYIFILTFTTINSFSFSHYLIFSLFDKWKFWRILTIWKIAHYISLL